MSIGTLPPPPSRADSPETFSTRADALLGALPQFVMDVNALAVELQDDRDAAQMAWDGAANSATEAANSAALAQDQVGLTTEQAALAAASAAAADQSLVAAQTAAAAAAAGAGLPSLAGAARRTLRVNIEETGVEWAVDMAVGDILATSRTLPAPEYLPCDGSTYLKSSYAALYGVLGQIPRTESRATLMTADPIGNIQALAYDGVSTYIGVGSNGGVLQGSDPADHWWVTPNLLASVYIYGAVGNGAGTIALVGSGGYICTWDNSTSEYTQRTSPIGTTGLYCVTYGNGLFIAGGESGAILTSPDGITWTSRISGFGSSAIYALAYGNGKYVAVGALGKIATSLDGITWTLRASGKTDNFRAVCYGNGLFVAGGESGAMLTSPDGITWTSRTSGVSTNTIYGIAYGNGRYVAVGSSGALTHSVDAVTWTAGTHNFPSIAILGAIYTTRFVIFGSSLASAGGVGTSSDGITFTQGCLPGVGTFNSATDNGDTLVAVDDYGRIVTFAGFNGWHVKNAPFGLTAINGVCSGELFCLVGTGGKIATSPDGYTWTTRTSGTTQKLKAVAYGNGAYVAVGDAGTVITSPDGVVWTVRAQQFSGGAIADITYGNNQFVIGALYGYVATSPDGVIWTNHGQLLGSPGMISVAYGNGVFVVLANTYDVWISTDGSHWSKLYPGFAYLTTAAALRFVNGLFVITGVGVYAVSHNGRVWNAYEYSKTGSTSKALAAVGGRIFVGGSNGAAFHMGPLHDVATMFSVPEKFDLETNNYVYTGVLA